MGCGASKPVVDEATKDMDKQLEMEKNRNQLTFKILVLGAGECGKSTLVKQLVFIHKRQMEESEKQSYISVLQTNSLAAVETFTKECAAFGYDSGWTEEEKGYVKQLEGLTTLSPEKADMIVKLWKSKPMQDTYSRRMEFWHLEASDYYFENAYRFAEADFNPTEEDIVMARKRTTGVVVTSFDYATVHWEVVDVGGQRSERRKWMNFFDGVKAILFMSNASGYAKVLFEDKNVNRLNEDLDLFESTTKNPIFFDTPIFLFLNKKDLFESMLKDTPLTKCFPEYTGENTGRECLEYIGKKFQERLPPGKAPAYVQTISASVKKDVKTEFDDVKDILLNINKKVIQKAAKDIEKFEKKYAEEEKDTNK